MEKWNKHRNGIEKSKTRNLTSIDNKKFRHLLTTSPLGSHPCSSKKTLRELLGNNGKTFQKMNSFSIPTNQFGRTIKICFISNIGTSNSRVVYPEPMILIIVRDALPVQNKNMSILRDVESKHVTISRKTKEVIEHQKTWKKTL